LAVMDGGGVRELWHGDWSCHIGTSGGMVMRQDQPTLESHRCRGAIGRCHTQRVVEVILSDMYETVVTLRGSGESLVSDSWRGVVQSHVHGSRAESTLAPIQARNRIQARSQLYETQGRVGLAMWVRESTHLEGEAEAATATASTPNHAPKKVKGAWLHSAVPAPHCTSR
jgi:hypothetical protein